MSIHLSFEEAIVAGFFAWLIVKLLGWAGREVGGWAWSGVVMIYDRIWYRIWAWRARPKKVRRKE